MKQLFKKYSIGLLSILFLLLIILSSFNKTEAMVPAAANTTFPNSDCDSGYHWEYVSTDSTRMAASAFLAQVSYTWECVPDEITFKTVTTPVVDPYADRTVVKSGPFTLTTNLSVVNNTVGQVNVKPFINVTFDNTWDVNNLAQSATNLNSTDYRQYVITGRSVLLDYYNKKYSWDNIMTSLFLTPIQQGWLPVTNTSIQSLNNHDFPDGGYQAPYINASGIKIKIVDLNGNQVGSEYNNISATESGLKSLTGDNFFAELLDTPSNFSNLPVGNYKAVITASPFISAIEEKCADKWYTSIFGDRICGWTGINGKIDRLTLEPHYSLQTVIPFSIKAVPVATCFDGIKNQNETGVDTGGVCGNCSDGIKNQNETGVDTGGVCGITKSVSIRVAKTSSPNIEILQNSERKTIQSINPNEDILLTYTPNNLEFPFYCVIPSYIDSNGVLKPSEKRFFDSDSPDNNYLKYRFTVRSNETSKYLVKCSDTSYSFSIKDTTLITPLLFNSGGVSNPAYACKTTGSSGPIQQALPTTGPCSIQFANDLNLNYNVSSLGIIGGKMKISVNGNTVCDTGHLGGFTYDVQDCPGGIYVYPDDVITATITGFSNLSGKTYPVNHIRFTDDPSTSGCDIAGSCYYASTVSKTNLVQSVTYKVPNPDPITGLYPSMPSIDASLDTVSS